jgi:hypothetical protein
MRKFITGIPGGYPNFDINWGVIQDSFTEIFNSLFLGLSPDTTNPYIVTGCAITNVTGGISVTQGSIFWNGELFQVPALTVMGSGTLYWQIVTNYYDSNPVTFNNGNQNNVHQIRTLQPTYTNPSSNGFNNSILTNTLINPSDVNKGIVPISGIIGWNGTNENVPNGWMLCDGSNGRPNLNDDSYILGSSSGNTGDGGGSNTITVDNLPSHNHTFSGSFSSDPAGGHFHSITDPGHSHTIKTVDPGAGVTYTNPQTNTRDSTYDYIKTDSQTTGISINAVADHTHTITGSGTISNTGGGVDFQPKYRKIKFIIRIA